MMLPIATGFMLGVLFTLVAIAIAMKFMGED